MSSFDCLVFWKQKWLVVRLKWLFSWFFVSVLIFDLGYIFWWSAIRWPSVNFNENKKLKSKLEDSSRKFVFFWALILSACIIISSLIHEVMTLMEQLFKFWDHHLSVQIAYLIKRSFFKHVMQAMVHGLWKKGNSQAQKVFEGFKDLGSTSTIHELSFSCCHCRESDI